MINAASGTIVPLGARLMLQSMPMHALAKCELTHLKDGCFRLILDPGIGSGPDIKTTLCPTQDRTLHDPWRLCFDNYHAFLAYCVPQNRAMACQPWYGRVSRQEIRLDIPLSECSPVAGSVQSRLAHEIADSHDPIGFHVAKVAFRFDGQDFEPFSAPRSAATRLPDAYEPRS